MKTPAALVEPVDGSENERMEFERWIRNKYPRVSLSRFTLIPSQYVIPDVQNAWLGWCARSALWGSAGA